MDNGTLNESHATPRYLAIIGFVIAALLSSGMYFGLAPKANAENFCLNVNLARYGQPGDRCAAPNGGWLYYVVAEDGNTSGCVASENNGVLLNAWACYPAHMLSYSYVNSSQWSHGIVRNNSTGAAGVFSGGQSGCPKQSCAP